jgi:hypothetical protein
LLEECSRGGCAEIGLAAVTTESDEMEIAGELITLEALSHSEILRWGG